MACPGCGEAPTRRKPKILRVNIRFSSLRGSQCTFGQPRCSFQEVLNSCALPKMELYRQAIDLATNPKHSRWIANALTAGEAVLCTGILMKVPCQH